MAKKQYNANECANEVFWVRFFFFQSSYKTKVVLQGVPFADIPNLFRQPTTLSAMEDILDVDQIFMIKVQYQLRVCRVFSNSCLPCFFFL